MTVQRNATVLPPHITRKAAYDRRTDGTHMTLTEWVEWKRQQFEAALLLAGLPQQVAHIRQDRQS